MARAASLAPQDSATLFVILELLLVVIAAAQLLATTAGSARVALQVSRDTACFCASCADQGAVLVEVVFQP